MELAIFRNLLEAIGHLACGYTMGMMLSFMSTLARPIRLRSVVCWWMELDRGTPLISGEVHITSRDGLAVFLSNGGGDPL